MRRRFFIGVIVSVILIFSLWSFSFAQEDGGCKTTTSGDELEKVIAACNQKLIEIGRQKNTLTQQIQYMDTQIYVTNLEINRNETRIEELREEIKNLGERIEEIDVNVERVGELVNKKIEEMYKRQRTNTLYTLVDIQNLPEFLRSVQYLQKTQKNDRALLIKLQNTKVNYGHQKILREEKEVELADLSIKLAGYKVSLSKQQEEKQRFLEVTRNDEKIYQEYLAQAQRELSQIQRAATLLQQTGKAVAVERGEVIGTQGNTGRSFGDHLHFGAYRYNSIDELSGWNWYLNNWFDPGEIVNSRTVMWNDGCSSKGQRTVGSGSFSWPLNVSEISQGSGYTCWSPSTYNGMPHPAWDMWGPINSLIYAAEKGTAYFCRNCLGDGGNGVFIFHENGIMTLYWHLQ